MKIFFPLISLLLFAGKANLYAQQADRTLGGWVLDKGTSKPLSDATLQLYLPKDTARIREALTDKSGNFSFARLKPGRYILKCSYVGYDAKAIQVDLTAQSVNAFRLELTAHSSTMKEVVVNAAPLEIDRKVYTVGQDIVGQSGSASDLLRNIPSVTVTVDGRVRLRESSSVTILINGRPSPLMKKSLRAQTLQQLPASAIESIEIITNPSAAFKPDGTAGIINIVLKKNSLAGWNASFSANAGSRGRYNGNVTASYKPGKMNLYSSFSVRDDYQYRKGKLLRDYLDTAGNPYRFYDRDYITKSYPLSIDAGAGATYTFNKHDEAGISVNYQRRTSMEHEDINKNFYDLNYFPTTQYDRFVNTPHLVNGYDASINWQHDFRKKDEKLRVDYNYSSLRKADSNYFTNVYYTPVQPNSFDNIWVNEHNIQHEVTIDYSNPLTAKSKLEAGYNGSFRNSDINLVGENFDPASQHFIKDNTRSNRFIYTEQIQGVYATYQRRLGKFGFNAGSRVVLADVKGNLVASDSSFTNRYVKVFPTLHLFYKFKKGMQLQLNYSKRVNWPESSDLNPFPNYRDPRNLQAGNPSLMPEITHSFELGFKWQNKKYSFVPSLYYRYKTNGFTNVLIPLDDSTTLRTQINLSTDQAAGLELIFTAKPGKRFNANLGANFFYNTVDRRDTSYGFRNIRAIYTMSLNANCTYTIGKNTSVQLNFNYHSPRITSQGKTYETIVLNGGIRQNLLKRKLSLVLTASDIFKSLRQKVELNSYYFRQTSIIQKDTRIIFIGATLHLGKLTSKSTSEEKLQFDNNL